MNITTQLAIEWQNPSNILALLFIIGGDIVQHAIAQLFGVYIQPFRNSPRLYLTPVAFSFGWVSYAFMSLASVLGDKPLMPPEPDCPSRVINCSSGYGRTNRSWVLGRILRDHELAVEENSSPEFANLSAAGKRVSLRIDIFQIQESETPQIDRVWILGWLTIVAQLVISAAPWVRHGDWGVFLVTASGTMFALMTGSLRQWNLENNGTAWDLESLATASSASLAETPWLLGVLAVLWGCLLITVSGLQQNAWFLVLIGGIGMVQNIYASVARRPASAFNMGIKPYAPLPTIVGLGFEQPCDDENSDEDLGDTTGHWRQPLDYEETSGVRGAIRELEKAFPKAGVALMQEFFPALVKYEPERYRTNAEKKFWKKAFRRFGMPVLSNHVMNE
ncbi:hypothetical protein TGAM01_v202021 [Trichoderma gamsii]|uniref:Uncharacterized protein n=1 Tax=Trichoderma gamsii TaxID=398673 RepID=A0A2P4ZXB8_9HYPO|nr:hypothetical protein TGAM01_v202021 [Trichoderma gamsii]PON28913.1 hypothetical protein TGAM01_v202021 [Trichoderma gamsii]